MTFCKIFYSFIDIILSYIKYLVNKIGSYFQKKLIISTRTFKKIDSLSNKNRLIFYSILREKQANAFQRTPVPFIFPFLGKFRTFLIQTNHLS